jgi:glycosyltransferase involved in cell wall biosynthesis
MINILCVVENFNGQAVESWLARIITSESFDPAQHHFDFFLLGNGPGRDAVRVLNRGCNLHEGNPGGASIPQMARALRRVVKRGSYDFVHIHQDVMGGVFALALVGLPVRLIIQAHNCWQRLPVGGLLKERLLTATGRWLAQRLANALIGVSHQALFGMTSGRSRHGRVDRVIYCSAKVPSIEPDTLARDSAASAMRRHFDLPESAKVLLFLGRLDGYKNPVHALDVLCAMISHGAKHLHLVIAGLGGLEPVLREMALERGVESHLHLVGWVDKPESLLLAVDLLIMPSQEICGEGLGLSTVEAQALGTPVLCSLSIPEDAMLIPPLFRRISLSEEIGSWRKAANELLEHRSPCVTDCWKAFHESPFTDRASYSALASLYSGLMEKRSKPEE